LPFASARFLLGDGVAGLLTAGAAGALDRPPPSATKHQWRARREPRFPLHGQCRLSSPRRRISPPCPSGRFARRSTRGVSRGLGAPRPPLHVHGRGRPRRSRRAQLYLNRLARPAGTTRRSYGTPCRALCLHADLSFPPRARPAAYLSTAGSVLPLPYPAEAFGCALIGPANAARRSLGRQVPPPRQRRDPGDLRRVTSDPRREAGPMALTLRRENLLFSRDGSRDNRPRGVGRRGLLERSSSPSWCRWAGIHAKHLRGSAPSASPALT